jgi:hypothetical protein
MGIAAIIGAGIFAMIGKASYNGGPAVDFAVCFYGDCLRIFRFVLRRIRFAHSGCGFGLHLRLRFDGRIYRVDYRLGFDRRIRHRQHRRRYFVERLFYGLLKGYGINFPLFDDGFFERVARFCGGSGSGREVLVKVTRSTL